MMWWHGDWSWWGWLWMSVTMLAFWGLVIGAIVVALRHPAGGDSRRSAEGVLAERFAAGEIDEDEYRRRLEVLRTETTRAPR